MIGLPRKRALCYSTLAILKTTDFKRLAEHRSCGVLPDVTETTNASQKRGHQTNGDVIAPPQATTRAVNKQVLTIRVALSCEECAFPEVVPRACVPPLSTSTDRVSKVLAACKAGQCSAA